MSVKLIVAEVIAVILLLLAFNSVFIVDQRERAILLEFGKVVRADILPGFHVKVPWINEVRKFDSRVLTLDAPAERFFTLEKKVVIVDSFAKYRIGEVQKYYTATSGDEIKTSRLLSQRINSGLRNEISKRTLHEVVSGERDELMTILTEQLDEVARTEMGVEVVDVRVKRIDLPPDVSQSVYNRMSTERDVEARTHRAQGLELAEGITADADKQVVVIGADAYRLAEEIKGDGDAESAQIYAKAFNKDKEFYKFYRSMDAYKNTFSSKSDILLIDPDSDFFTYLKKSKK